MVEYLIEMFEWVNDDKFKYYHLADSKVFKSSKNLKDRTYCKNNKFITVSKLSINEA